MKTAYYIDKPMRYAAAWDLQKQLFELRRARDIPDTLFLTEHPPVYTLGKQAKVEHLLMSEDQLKEKGIDVHWIDRGGDITFHGPGQLVGYPIFDLNDHYKDVGRFLRELEEVIIQTLAEFNLEGTRVDGFTGVWVGNAKVAAIGIKISRWVTMHGFALNVNPDMAFFGGIIPCGITDRPVTSMAELVGKRLEIGTIKEIILKKFSIIFNLEFVFSNEERLTKKAEIERNS